MLFKINCIKSDGSKDYWLFDNQTLEIKTSKNVPAVFEQDPRFDEFRPKQRVFTSKSLPLVGKSNIKTIKLSLGFKCNYKCEYCWQRQFEQYALDASPIQVYSFMQKLSSMDLSKLTRIELWGGEPLAYWKTIKALVPQLKSAYPKADIYILSNGSLMTREIADFCVEYDVKLGISHDAQAFTKYRDKEDPLDNPNTLDAIKYYCNKCMQVHNRSIWFCVTISRYNIDIDEIYPFFKSKLGEDTPFYVHVDNAVETASKEEHDKYAFTQEERDFFFKKIRTAYLDPVHPLNADLSKELRYAIFQIVNAITPRVNQFGCDMANSDVISMNMRGDVLPCHSFPAETVGMFNALDKVVINKLRSWESRENCKRCPILPICHGGKPCVTNEEHSWLCDQMVFWKYPIFIAAWKVLFDADIVSIENA